MNIAVVGNDQQRECPQNSMYPQRLLRTHISISRIHFTVGLRTMSVQCCADMLYFENPHSPRRAHCERDGWVLIGKSRFVLDLN